MKMRALLLFVTLSIGLLLSYNSAKAQALLDYTFNYSYGNTYTPITGAHTFLGGAPGVIYGGSAWNVTLPFSFRLDNRTSSTMYVHSSGMITPSPVCYGGSYYYYNNVFYYNRPTMMAFSQYGRTAPTTGTLKVQVQGVAPNRVAVFEWNDWVYYYPYIYGYYDINGSYQIALYETSNIVEFRYGDMALANYTWWPGYPYAYQAFGCGISGCTSGQYINIKPDEGGQPFVAHYSNKNPAPDYDQKTIYTAAHGARFQSGLVMRFVAYPILVSTYPSQDMILKRSEIYHNGTNPSTHPSVYIQRVNIHPEVYVRYKISGPLPIDNPNYKTIYEATESETLPNNTLFRLNPQPVGNNVRCLMPSAKGIAARYDGALDLATNWQQITPGEYVLEAEMVLPAQANYTQALPTQTFKIALANDLAAYKIMLPALKAFKKYPLGGFAGVPIRVKMRNVGINDITNFTVTAKIYSMSTNQLVYSQPRTFDLTSTPLKTGDYHDVEFPAYIPRSIGDFRIVFESTLDNALDENPSSNSLPFAGSPDHIFKVAEEIEVEAISVAQPTGKIYVNRPIRPVGVFQNNGVYDVSNVPVRCKILYNGNPEYDEQIILQDIPSSGLSQSSAFFGVDFVPNKIGQYTIIISDSVVGDKNTTNDTYTTNFEVVGALAGNYTISANGTGTNNFKTIQEAVNALYERGVSGPVVFELTDSYYEVGSSAYFESPALDLRSNIIGVNSTNTVTFKPSGARSVVRGGVTIKMISESGIGMLFGNSIIPNNQFAAVLGVNSKLYNKYSKSAGYIIWDGGSQKAFKLTLETSNSFRAPVYLGNGASNISIKNCLIENAMPNNVSWATSLPLSRYNSTAQKFEYEDDATAFRAYSAGIVIRNKPPMNEIEKITSNTYKLDTVLITKNIIEGNEINGFGYGIVSLGIGPLQHVGMLSNIRYYNTGNTIKNNIIYNVAKAGIFLGFEEKSDVTFNRIYNINGAANTYSAGIVAGGEQRTGWFGYNNVGVNISSNEISQVASSTEINGVLVYQSSFDLQNPAGSDVTRFPDISESMIVANNSIWGFVPGSASTNRFGVKLTTERNPAVSGAFTKEITPMNKLYSTRNDIIANNTIIIDGDAGVLNTGLIAGVAILNAKGTTFQNNAIAILDNEIDPSNEVCTGLLYAGMMPGAGSLSSDRNAFDLSNASNLVRFVNTDANNNIITLGYANEYKTMDQWTAWTKSDKNSIFGNFRNDLAYVGSTPAKLRIKSVVPTGSILNNRGNEVSAVKVDIDGNPRGVANQRYDIGAFEFNGKMYTTDLEIVRMTAPLAYKAGTGTFADAEYIMTTYPIEAKVLIRNNGTMLQTDAPVTVKIYQENPDGTYPTTPVKEKTVKVTIPSTETVEVTFGLGDENGSGDDFVPKSFNQLTGYTIPAHFNTMKNNVTPKYKYVVSIPSDEMTTNNALPWVKEARFYLKRSLLHLVLSTENSFENIGAGTMTPSAEDQNKFAGKLNADSLVAAFAKIGYYVSKNENLYDIDLFDRNGWETRNVNYNMYRSLFWADGNNSSLSLLQMSDISKFVAAGKETDKKNLILASEEFVRNNSVTTDGATFVKNTMRAINKAPGQMNPTVGNKITGVTLARNLTTDILVTGFPGDADPIGGLMNIWEGGEGTARLAYYYANPTNLSSNNKIMSIASSTLRTNVVGFGIDWRHFGNLEFVLRSVLDYSAANGGTIVPVELLSFDANAMNNRVELVWSTASETESSRFDIERAESAKSGISTFDKVGEVPAVGNSSVITNYGPFVDRDVVLGNTYIYRLKMIDKDGQFDYSDEKVVTLTSDGAVVTLGEARPNPVNTVSTIEYSLTSEMFVSLKVYDITGKEVAMLFNGNLAAGNYSAKLNASSLVNGVYTVVLTANNTTLTKQITVSK